MLGIVNASESTPHPLVKYDKHRKDEHLFSIMQEKTEIPLLFHLVVLFLRYVERKIRKLFD